MNKNIDGMLVSKVLYKELNDYLLKKDIIPNVVDICIGNDFGCLMYSKCKKKRISKETCINFKCVYFEDISYLELKRYIEELNNDDEVTGIMLQLPLPKHLEKYERDILDTIDYNKDIDGLTTMSIGKLSSNGDSLVPCTALGIESLLKVYDVWLEGKLVAIVNRSNIVGKALMYLMLRNNASFVMCHSKTKNLSLITRQCDIVIVGVNKSEYITSEYVKDGAVVVDVGVHSNGRGDVDYYDVYDKVSLITPSVGGVGPMTVCMLAYNAAKVVYGDEVNDVLERGILKAKIVSKQRTVRLQQAV